MKKITLDKTWELCLKMWKWISKQAERGETENVDVLKAVWLERNGFFDEDIANACFFCEYCNRHNGEDCSLCPAVQIDKNFSCLREICHFDRRPREFYAELLRLNKIRLAKKRKTKCKK